LECADVILSEDVVLHSNVTIYAGSVVGPRTIIHAGAVIGSDGFGMAEESGRWLKIPQIGRVVIGADCEIGANTTIDRGAIDDTVIEDDVKLDNQIQIGHNCVIGAHTAIAGCVGIAGSTRIGRNCKIGGAAMISGHLSIADNTIVSGSTGVFHSIDKPGVYTGAFPALPYREWQRAMSATRRLRTFEARLNALERMAGRASGNQGEEES
jgi:UDP-3-O-[3-hydroxymyristoyl] glucosamine N-acyltransferase